MRYVQPAFVNAKRLDQVGVITVNEIYFTGILRIQVVMRRQEDEIGAFFLRLPDRLRCLDAVFFGRLVFRQNDAVTLRRVAADRDRHAAQLRAAEQLAGGIERVAVTV